MLANHAICVCTCCKSDQVSSGLQALESFNDVVELFYPDDMQKQAKAATQMAAFRNREGTQWKRGYLEASAVILDAHSWWQQFGSHAPELQHIAVRLLSQVSSACTCERIWSTFDFIHSRRRNRLHVDRATKLVYIFTNLRLLDKESKDTLQDAFPAWRELAEELNSEPEDSAEVPEGSNSSSSASSCNIFAASWHVRMREAWHDPSSLQSWPGS